MRILHTLKHGVRGNGHVHVAVDLACAQADAGHAVVFATSGGTYDDLLESHGVEVVTLPELGGVRKTGRAAWSLLQEARRFSPDILHAHMMSSAVLGFAVSKIVRAPLLTTVHNSFDRHSVLMRLGKKVVAVSEAERQLLLSRGYRSTKVVTVLNGTEGSAREVLEGEIHSPLARPCIVSVGGLSPRKAVDDTIRAFAALAPEFPGWHLNIIGWGPDLERLEALTEELGLGSQVHFLGPTLNPRPLMEQADIFVSASLADPCPLVVPEARSAGCAIVATSVGGVPELLEHGRAGQLTPPSDPGAMAAALRKLMADPEVLADWRARAREGAGYFSVQRMADDYLRVYRSVLR
jgi:glycosyltransferase involved in cell wall biosynthesis